MAKMLVIDDDPIITQMCKAYFTAKGHTVTVALDGKEGLEKYKKGIFDIVITDLMMPTVHGFRVIDEIKLSSRGDKTAVILLSADKDEPNLKNYKRKKFQDDTINKPFDIPVLERMVAKLLEEFADQSK